MARRISVSRAARLVGVKRGTLQQKIRRGELKTFEGELLLSDLLQAYPSATIEDTSMLDRVEQIMEQATFIVGDTPARRPREPGNTGLLSFYQWCKDAVINLEKFDEQTDDPLANEVFLRIMAAQVTVLPSGHEFFIEGADTILEAGLRGGLALNYGCSNGNCGLCKVRVVSGEVKKMRHHDYQVTEAEKGLGYILSCANTAVTDIVLEADEAEDVYDIPAQQIPIRIKKIEHPNEEVMIVNTRTPRTNRLRFLAGQQVELAIDDIGIGNYPIASCPCDDMNLQFHIPNQLEDPVASYINSDVKINDTIILRGPNGSFTLNDNSPNALVFIAQGSGFAPIKGLIEHAMALDSAENIHLYWLAGSNNGYYLHNLCRSWSDALDNFYYTQIMQDSADDWVKTFCTQLQANHQNLQNLDYYICAEQGITVEVETFLIENKVPDSQIKIDTHMHF
jgi:CDP-4-dehydro-6-deoxyglucose reductase